MRAYLDHNATAPLRPEANAALSAVLAAPAGNASSLHAEGRAARARIEEARARVAALCGVPARDVVFTSGGTEAIAAAIRGIADRATGERRRIIISSIEHSAVLDAARALARSGFEVVEVACERSGAIDAARFAREIDARVALAALQAANNETGVIQPVAEVGSACRAAGAAFLVDAVQTAGKVPIDREGWSADLVAISGHKLGGPQGTGALIVREGLALAPLLPGGAQERRRRGGTEPVAAIAGFGAACEAASCDRDLLPLRARLEAGLRAASPDVRIHGEGAPRLPNTVNAAFPGVSGETLVIALDLAGFAAATGSACASGAVEPSHVLRAMGLDEEAARGAVRFSMGWSTTEAEVDRLVEALPALVARATMARP